MLIGLPTDSGEFPHPPPTPSGHHPLDVALQVLSLDLGVTA